MCGTGTCCNTKGTRDRYDMAMMNEQDTTMAGMPNKRKSKALTHHSQVLYTCVSLVLLPFLLI